MRKESSFNKDTDELMEKIRTELRRIEAHRKTERQTFRFSSDSSFRPFPDSFPGKSYASGIISEAPPFEPKSGGYHIDDFLRYHDADFIRNAYAGVLGREPDPHGSRYYLENLRRGKLTPKEILVRIRFSPEGRRKRVKVKGLLFPLILHSSYRIPVLGYIGRLFIGFLQLPVIIRNIQTIDAFSRHQDAILKDYFNRMQVVTGGEFEHVPSDKAGKEELNEAISRKVNIHDFDQVEHKLQKLMEREDGLLDQFFFSVADKFRGTREEIKNRLKVYLPYVDKANAGNPNPTILDIGCGRGEWLELLSDKGYSAKGVELNRTMIEFCRGMGFEVIEADAVEFLKKQVPGEFSIITGFHVIEHLPLKCLVSLFDEAFRILKPGGMIIFETPNPENLIVSAYTFYLDPTHKKPLPPDMIREIALERGFRRTEIVRLHDRGEMGEIDEFKQKWFCSATDYALIGYKS